VFFTVILSLIVLSVGACTNPEPAPPDLPEPLPEVDWQKIAYDFVGNSPTFLFDGIEGTLKLVDTIELSSPDSFTYIYQFDSSHAGYGDRKDQVLAQVITPHEALITVENGDITHAAMDNTWDMLYQEELSEVADSKTQEAKDKKLLEDIKWVLESYGEQESLKTIIEGTRITATFDGAEGRVNGSAGCNNYFGEYRIVKNNLSIPLVGNTEMYCMEPEGRMEQETQYLKLLNSAESYEVSDNKLRIYAGSQVLVYASEDVTEISEQGASFEFSCDSFIENNHISLSYSPEIEIGDSITVTLCSNPTTGFRWSESAEISNQSVLEQISHGYTAPEDENIVGGAGKETWTFRGIERGMASISIEYSRPWEGGEQGEWTFSITVKVK